MEKKPKPVPMPPATPDRAESMEIKNLLRLINVPELTAMYDQPQKKEQK